VLHSAERVLTTHAGSLPRPQGLSTVLASRSRGEPVDEAALARAAEAATREAVAKQIACGIDVGNDGEQPRESFFTHLRERLSGFGGSGSRPFMRDLVAYPSFIALRGRDFERDMVSLLAPPRCEGPVAYVDRTPLEREIAGFNRALAAAEGRFAESFWTSPSPGIVACAMQDAHYRSLERYVDAVADALRTEYEAIVAAGFVLQIDGPDLAMERHTLFADRPLAEFLAFVDHVVAALNRALAGIPPDRVRLHVCWGNYEGPHTHDVALDELKTLARHGFPKHMALVAGVIDTTTNYVEHPEVVADRLELAARAVGDPHRILAGTDCGFGTAAGLGEVADEIVWLKLRALAAGAARATNRLLG
jgi:5-methyltetrahydropteroyltriglutamate--homocysteine methyltransferase